jgi:hypothetical protein
VPSAVAKRKAPNALRRGFFFALSENHERNVATIWQRHAELAASPFALMLAFAVALLNRSASLFVASS